MTSGGWTIHVDDSFHTMDEDARYTHGSLDAHEDAVSACRTIVDTSLKGNPAESADGLFRNQTSSGGGRLDRRADTARIGRLFGVGRRRASLQRTPPEGRGLCCVPSRRIASAPTDT